MFGTYWQNVPGCAVHFPEANFGSHQWMGHDRGHWHLHICTSKVGFFSTHPTNARNKILRGEAPFFSADPPPKKCWTSASQPQDVGLLSILIRTSLKYSKQTPTYSLCWASELGGLPRTLFARAPGGFYFFFGSPRACTQKYPEVRVKD